MSKLMMLCTAVFGTLAATGASFEGPDGCRAEWDETSLTVGNALFDRTWRLDGTVLRTTSFALKEGAAVIRADGSFPVSAERLSVSCRTDADSAVSAPSLVVTAAVAGRTTTIRLYGSVPGVVVSQDWTDAVPSGPSPKDYMAYIQDAWGLIAAVTNRMDSLAFMRPNLRLTEYRFRDQTDVHDVLMETSVLHGKTVELPRRHFCAVMDAYDPLDRTGAVFLRLAPQPASRPEDIPDFIADANHMPIRLVPVPNGYPLAELLYQGAPDERIAALRALQRAIRPYRPGRDGVFLSNTWGGGNCDSRINAAFLEKEIAAGAEIGVDVIQIDDGWQHGRTSNSMLRKKGEKGAWNGYWAADPDFWKPAKERFPEGLEPLVAKARGHGMRFGLWFGPDSSNEAANWERDADCLLDYYRRLDIAYFKVDSLKLHSALGFARCRRMFDKMLTGSKGGMVFDLDATAEVRPGFFGVMDIGPVFVENRYARSNYRPWATLASLWQLSHAIDPLRLRMEVVDPDPDRVKIDGSNPLAATHWPLDAGFAIAMFASPLGWMELSEVSAARKAALRPLVATWKRERDNLYAGVTFPVGERPDGFAWTGFVNRGADGKSGFALLFRELNGKSAFSLPLDTWFGVRETPHTARVIGGRGTAVIREGALEVDVPSALDFVWVKLEN